MAKLVIDQLECITRTDSSGDDPYIIIMHVGPDCTVTRADSPQWSDIEDALPRKGDVVLVNNFYPGASYLIAIIDQEDGNDFNPSIVAGMSLGMQIAYQQQAQIEKDLNRLTAYMLILFTKAINDLCGSSDDVLHTQLLTTTQPIEFDKYGAHYKLKLKVIN